MKKLLSIALVGLLAGAAIGCGPKAQTTPPGDTGGTGGTPPPGGDTTAPPPTAPGAPPAQ